MLQGKVVPLMPPEVPQAPSRRGQIPWGWRRQPMREEVTPAGLGNSERAADVEAFPAGVEEMKGVKEPGLLPMVVPTFGPPVPPSPVAGLPPHGAPVTEVQRLQESFDQVCELLTDKMGNVEKMNDCFGEFQLKVQGSMPEVGKDIDEMKVLGCESDEVELFKDTFLELVHTSSNLKIVKFQRYLVSRGFWQRVAPTPSAPLPIRVFHLTYAASVPRPKPSGDPPRTLVPPVPSRPAPPHEPDVAPGSAFAPPTPYNAPIDSFGFSHPSSSRGPKIRYSDPRFPL